MKASSARAGFGPFDWKSMAAITEGTSNTVAISETLTGNGNDDKRVKSAFAINVNVSLSTFVAACLGKYDANDINQISGASYGGRGAVVFDGRATVGGFSTILPPNSPSCSRWEWLTHCGLFTPSSAHSGGVNDVFSTVPFASSAKRSIPERPSCTRTRRPARAFTAFGARWERSTAAKRKRCNAVGAESNRAIFNDRAASKSPIERFSRRTLANVGAFV